MNKIKDSDDERVDIKLLNKMGKPVRFEKIIRGSRTKEDPNQMPDEDCSSHQSSVFTQIAERENVFLPNH